MTGVPRSGGEPGSASVLVAVATVVIVTLGSAGLAVAAAAQVAATARTAADLGALAGATSLIQGLQGSIPGDPCAVAADIVARNGAVQRSCDLDDEVNLTVVVAVELPGRLARLPGVGPATAAARAGPAP